MMCHMDMSVDQVLSVFCTLTLLIFIISYQTGTIAIIILLSLLCRVNKLRRGKFP